MRFALIFSLLLAACGGETEDARARCATCGMVVDAESGWRAGATADGETLAFDAPKCLFRRVHREGSVEGGWVIEYYSQERAPARELFYVIGSDLESPMGRDLVPVRGREEAERLRDDHHGEAVLSYDEVTSEVVEGLFTPRA